MANLACGLNFLKTGEVEHLLACFPINERCGQVQTRFLSLADIQLNWLLTSPKEATTHADLKLGMDVKECRQLLTELPVAASATGNRLMVMLNGKCTIAKTLSYQASFGFCGGLKGGSMGYLIQGKLGSVVDISLAGQIDVNANPAELAIGGNARLQLFGTNIMQGSVSYVDDTLHISGHLNAFPDNKFLQLSTDIAGDFSSSKVCLNGDCDLMVDRKTLLSGTVTLNHERFEVSGKFLGLNTTLQITQDDKGSCLVGHLSDKQSLDLSTGPIKIAGVQVSDGYSEKVLLKIGLVLTITTNSFALKAVVKFTALGDSLSFTEHFTVAPGSLEAMLEKIMDSAEQLVENKLIGLFKSGETGALKALGFAAKTIGHAYKYLLHLSTHEVGQLLKDADFAVDDVANTVKSIGTGSINDVAATLKSLEYDAASAAEGLLHAGFHNGKLTALKFGRIWGIRDQQGLPGFMALRFQNVGRLAARGRIWCFRGSTCLADAGH